MINYFKELLATLKSIDESLKELKKWDFRKIGKEKLDKILNLIYLQKTNVDFKNKIDNTKNEITESILTIFSKEINEFKIKI